MDEVRQLIILGNGFDLACGLKSTYSDFFKWRFSKIFSKYNFKLKNNNKITKEYSQLFLQYFPLNVNITFWDIFFLNEKENLKDKNWTDIEEAIKRVVSYIFYPQDDDWWIDYSDETKLIIKSINKCLKEKSQKENRSLDIIKQNYYYSELKKFEQNFEIYIGEQKRVFKIQNRVLDKPNSIYFQKVLEKLNNLMIGKSSKDKHYILSFNYTIGYWDKVIRDNLKSNYKIEDIYDIHGYVPTDIDNTYDGQHYPIIFGIDGSIIKGENDRRIPFTKATRVLENLEFLKDLPENITRIDFYGHSLSKPDYSYFEALFEKYNLCNSNLVLYFHYGTYGLKENKYKNLGIKKDQFCLVNNLLTHYGNKKKQKGLFNRLIYNKRIYFIPDKGARDEKQ